MARWKLATSHYLNTVKPAKWRYSELDQTSGETIEKEFHVPRMLDINDPRHWTNKWGNRDNPVGEIIVCQPGKGSPGDIEFLGDPTPDMLPQDEEAEAISATFADHWAWKPDAGEIPHSQSIVERMDTTPQPVQIEGMAELVVMMAASQKTTADLVESLVRRRV